MKSHIGGEIKLIKATGIHPQLAAAGTLTSSAIDVRDYGSLVLTAMTGAIAGGPSAQTVDVKIQASTESGGTYADYVPPTPHPGTATAAVAQITAANTEKHVDVNLAGVNYIKVVAVTAFTGGTTPTIGLAVALALGGARSAPPASY
jgi:hypothetical protein